MQITVVCRIFVKFQAVGELLFVFINVLDLCNEKGHHPFLTFCLIHFILSGWPIMFSDNHEEEESDLRKTSATEHQNIISPQP